MPIARLITITNRGTALLVTGVPRAVSMTLTHSLPALRPSASVADIEAKIRATLDAETNAVTVIRSPHCDRITFDGVAIEIDSVP
jgi:hypothetical protein